MAETTQNQSGSVIRTPGPYPEGGEAIWQEFMNRFFGNEETGDPGLLDLSQGNAAFTKEQWNDFYKNTLIPEKNRFTEALDYGMGAGGRFLDRMSGPEQTLDDAYGGVQSAQDYAKANPISIGFGGQKFNMAPQGRVNMAQTRFADASNMYGQKGATNTAALGFESSIFPGLAADRFNANISPEQQNMMQNIAANPGLIEQGYITENLLPLASGIQGMRYGIPTQMSSGSSSSDTELGWPGYLGLAGGLASNFNIGFDDIVGGLGDFGKWLGNLDFGLNWGSGGNSAANNPHESNW